jgi:small basic protein
MYILVGLVLGLLIGLALPYQLPLASSKYISVAFLAGLDSVLGGTRAGIERKFDIVVFVTGFATNLTLAALLTLVGDALGVDIYLAAVVTFGARIFQNLAYIRRDLLGRPVPDSAPLSSVAGLPSEPRQN